MGVCKCTSGAKNTGSACTSNASPYAKAILMNKFKQDGTLNGIDFNADSVDGVIPKAVIDGKINEANAFDRWYPVGDFENIEDVRAEFLAQTFNSGNSVKIKDGVRSFTGLLVKKAPSYVGVLESFGCWSDLAVMYVDVEGNLVGESLDGNYLAGIKVDNNTLSAIYNKTNDTEVSAVTLQYSYAQTVGDENLSMITADGLESDMTSIKGLLDMVIAPSSTATQTNVAVAIDYGSTINDQLRLTSLEAGDFELYNITQTATVTIDSVDTTNAVDGVYLLAHASGVTASDVLRLTITKAGYQTTSINITVS